MRWLWILAMFLVTCASVYFFVPRVRNSVDAAIKVRSAAILDDRKFHLPDYVAIPDRTVEQFYRERKVLLHGFREWGSPSQDGPDRSMPHACMWLNGMLHCRFPDDKSQER
jgi:hypothetical protein